MVAPTLSAPRFSAPTFRTTTSGAPATRQPVLGETSKPRADSYTGPVTSPSDARYAALPAAAKRKVVWGAIERSAYEKLPELGSQGVGSGKTGMEQLAGAMDAFSIGKLKRVFKETGDAHEARTRIFNTFGTVGQVAFEPVKGHPYTGLFASGAVGITRMSLVGDNRNYTPAVAIKLFRDGAGSADMFLGGSSDPQESRDFFLLAMTNDVPPPTTAMMKVMGWFTRALGNPFRSPIEHLARTDVKGAEVADAKAPHQIFFEPAGTHFAADTKKDFRELLGEIPAGTVLYDVYAKDKDGEKVLIGKLETQSRFVASEFGDRELNFQHRPL